MKIADLKQQLNELSSLNIISIYGTPIPSHFHVTEVGLITKHYIDCGGKVRLEKYINMQIWFSDDTDHRINPKKLLQIISQSEYLFNNEDLEIEVEYQSDTIGKFGLDFDGFNFILKAKQTQCLAEDSCGIPSTKLRMNIADLPIIKNQCDPKSACC